MKRIQLCLLGVCLLQAFGIAAQEKLAIELEKTRERQARSINWNLKNFGIETRHYETKDFESKLNQDFINDLGKAQLLSVGNAFGDSFIFKYPEQLKAFEDFLARGGTVLYQYNGGFGSPLFWKKHELGTIPGLLNKDEGVKGEVNPAIKSPLLSEPNDLRKFTGFQQFLGNGCWPKWTDKQQVLIQKVGDPNAGILLLFENVLGKGRIIINRVVKVDTHPVEQSKYSRALVENIIRYVWGELSEGGVSETAAPSKPAADEAIASERRASSLPVEGLNPLYLRGLMKTTWWNPGWSQRLPLIVHEPMGRNRPNLVVSFEHRFPAGTSLSSIRVVTSGGREIASQARAVKVEETLFEVCFADNFDASATNGYFVYSDSQEKPKTQYPDDMILRRADGLITMGNNFTKAELSESVPIVLSLQPRGNSSGNQFKCGNSFEDLTMGFRPCGNDMEPWEVTVLEDGPVRKTVEYKQPKRGALRYSMDIGSRTLCLESKGGTGSFAAWHPGKGVDGREDSFCYAAQNGVRKIAFTVEDRAASPNLAKEFTEGWYAFVDGATGQTVGELFDVDQLESLTFSLTSDRSTRCVTNKRPNDTAARRALVALPDNAGMAGLRQEYLWFNNPPQVALGKTQARGDCPEKPAKPVLGRDFVTGYHTTPGDPFFALWKGSYGKYFDTFLPRLQERGFNLFDIWFNGRGTGIMVKGDELNTSMYVPLREKTAARGMLAGCYFPHIPQNSGDYTKYRMCAESLEPQIKIAEGLLDLILTGNHLDAIALQDESTYHMLPGDRESFRKLYNMDPVEHLVASKLLEPAQHNTAIFQINAYTELLRRMAAVAKRVDPAVVIYDQVNPSSMNGLSDMNGGTHDWEAQAEFLDSISMDLYDKPNASFKSFIKFMTAMFDNKKTVQLYIGCTTRPEHIYSSVAAPLMWGVGTFIFFTPRNTNLDDTWRETGRTFSYFGMTGLGDWMASARQNKRVALLRDREAMFDAIRKGRWGNTGNLYDTAIAELSQIKNVQSDIVMTRHFSAATAARYPVLYVASDPVLAEKHAKTIEAYVKDGGHAVIEAETIKSPILQALAGVKSDGVTTEAKIEAKGQFSFTGPTCSATAEGAEVVLKDATGKPILFERKVGKGMVTYLSAALSSKTARQEDVRHFLRALFDRLAGPQLVGVDKDSMELIDSGLQEDGKGGYVFSAWNPGFETRTVKATWNGPGAPEEVVDCADGSSRPFAGSIEFELCGDHVKQFFLGKKGAMPIPEAKIVPPGSMPGYSATPGEHIISYQTAAPAAAAAAATTAAKRPAKLDGQSYVAVFAPPTPKGGAGGAKSIMDSLSTRKGIKAEAIGDLRPDTLSYFDAVVIPNIGLYSNVETGWETSVHDYVRNGGSALICHRSTGYKPCSRPPLPEIAGNLLEDRVSTIRDMEVVADHPVTSDLVLRRRYPVDYKNPAYNSQIDATALKVGEKFRIGFCDYVPLKPAADTIVLVKGADDCPAVVAGKLGKGKAVLAGMAIGQDEKGAERMAPDDEKILVNSIYWLVEKQ